MKRLLALGFILACLLFPFAAASAVDVVNPICQNPNVLSLPVNQRPSVCQDNATTSSNDPILGSNGILATIINILSLIASIIAVIVIIIGGVKMIVSSGDSNAVASSRRTILYAVISLLIVAGAQLGVHLLIDKL